MQRSEILDNVRDCICTTRPQIHGQASEAFDLANDLKLSYEARSKHRVCGAHEEAMRMVFHKIARIACGGISTDHYIDAMGYLAIACECITSDEEKKDDSWVEGVTEDG